MERGVLHNLHEDLIKDLDQDAQRVLLRSIKIFTILARILKDHDHILKDLQRFLKILEGPCKDLYKTIPCKTCKIF